MSQISLALWDFNGTIDNSEILRNKTFHKTLEDFALTFNDRHHLTLTGILEPDDVARYLSDVYPIDASVKSIADRYSYWLWRLLDEQTAPLPGVTESLNVLDSLGIKSVILSNSQRWFVDKYLPRLGIADRFAGVVTPEDVEGRRKPDPEIFKRAAERFGIGPENCLVVGDTSKDIDGANAAGMRSILVPNSVITEEIKNATLVLGSLKELNRGVIVRLESGQFPGKERSF